MTANEDLIKELVILIFCLRHAYKDISIRFISTESHDIYYIANPVLFLPYISQLIQGHPSSSYATVVLVNIDLIVTFEILNSLSKIIDDIKNRIDNSQTNGNASTIMSKYQEIGNPLTSENTSLESIRMRLHIINDCSLESKKTIFSAKMVALQQVLRFLSLRHRASFSASSNPEIILNDTTATLNLLALLKDDTPQPVFDFVHLEDDSMSIHQKIPLGWDTIHKILLVAKSAPYLSPGSCFREQEELEELEKYFLEANNAPPQGSLLTAKLASYNLVELERNKQINEDPPVCTTYRDVLTKLENC